MPNTLAHLGVQALATRALLPRSELRWIALGCVIPDLPWIGQRIIREVVVDIDLYDLRLYAIAQASLAVSLLACAGFACLSREPRRVFGVLSFNALIHLLLDAAQTKWANGVHLFAPLSWETWNLGLFWPESVATYGLTVLGLAIYAWLPRGDRSGASLEKSPRARGLAVAFGLAYLLLPLALLAGPEDADSHSVRTLRQVEARPGRWAEFDRAPVLHDDGRDEVVTLSGERIALVAGAPIAGNSASLRGSFLDVGTFSVDAQHEHVAWLRDLATYVGLGLLCALWLPGFRPSK